MPLSWNEIKQRAIQFSKEWASEKREEAKSFWDEFFNVFGVRRRTVATVEEPVKNFSGQFLGSTLVNLYDPLAMPPELVRARQALDRAVDRAYRPAPSFPNDRARVEFLFARYAELTALLKVGMAGKAKRGRKYLPPIVYQ